MSASDGRVVTNFITQTLNGDPIAGVDNRDNAPVDSASGPIGASQRLGKPLGFAVDASRTDGIDASPLFFALRMHRWIAVNLARRGEDESHPRHLGDAKSALGCPASDRSSVFSGRRW